MSTNLLETTLAMARASQLPITRICEAVQVTPRWYYKLLSGEIKDPSVRRVQRLHDFLTADPVGMKGNVVQAAGCANDR